MQPVLLITAVVAPPTCVCPPPPCCYGLPLPLPPPHPTPPPPANPRCLTPVPVVVDTIYPRTWTPPTRPFVCWCTNGGVPLACIYAPPALHCLPTLIPIYLTLVILLPVRSGLVVVASIAVGCCPRSPPLERRLLFPCGRYCSITSIDIRWRVPR